jgi:hypothetical protein
VLKRPFVDRFLVRARRSATLSVFAHHLITPACAQVECATRFEIVVFTASLSKYADPLLDLLDKNNTVRGQHSIMPPLAYMTNNHAYSAHFIAIVAVFIAHAAP